jgi:hypothetical protein
MRQVEDYVRPCLTSRVPTICMFLSSLFQERISNFAAYMLLQNAGYIVNQKSDWK